MPRRRYYRRAVRVVPAKKKWATHMTDRVLTTSLTTNASYGVDDLVVNSAQTATPTPVIVKTGNFKVQGDCVIQNVEDYIPTDLKVIVYIMYLPEGVYSESLNNMGPIITAHPEWVMAFKMVDVDVTSSTSKVAVSGGFSFSSRLKRNLNSGDKVSLVVFAGGTNTAPLTPHNIRVSYVAQWWTCSN